MLEKNAPHTDDINVELPCHAQQLRHLLWKTAELHPELTLTLGVDRRQDAHYHPGSKQ